MAGIPARKEGWNETVHSSRRGERAEPGVAAGHGELGQSRYDAHPPATADGFTLTTFASGFPNSGTNTPGPIGIAFPSSGSVMVTDVASGQVVIFPTDTDGQSYPGSSSVGGGCDRRFGHPLRTGVHYLVVTTWRPR
jgi:hypothetical protein